MPSSHTHCGSIFTQTTEEVNQSSTSEILAVDGAYSLLVWLGLGSEK